MIELEGSVDLIWSEPVARLVMYCPQKRNALSLSMWKDIAAFRQRRKPSFQRNRFESDR